MKFFGRTLATLALAAILSFFTGCGGSGGGSSGGTDASSTGTLSMSMTDAKPLLPETSGKTITNVFVTIDDVLVHSPGGGWVSLASKMVENPYTIDLLQFTDGVITEFVPPVPLETGKYTQIRLSVEKAWLRFDEKPNDEVEITVPSENLKTDQNFDFDMTRGEAVDITIDFDLSKSLVLEGPEYKLKPVLHIVETDYAATIAGTVANDSFGDPEIEPAVPGDPTIPPYVIIAVFDNTGQEYTKVQVDRNDSATDGLTNYSIYWLVPDQDYTACIDYDPLTNRDAIPTNCKNVAAGDVGLGEVATVKFP
jgi:hypothetical protein